MTKKKERYLIDTNIMLDQASIIIPTFNAGQWLQKLIHALKSQGIRPEQVFVIDSTSADNTADELRAYGARVNVIPQCEFNHGATRQLAANICNTSPFLIYLTHDAIPIGSHAFHSILTSFADPKVAMAYGRQIPREGASAIERHARLFNYPPVSEVRDLSCSTGYGVKTIFASDSFAAYRASSLRDVGGFPLDCFFAEDQIVAGRLLLAGYKLAYAADACVIHSHGYSTKQDFQRYFDVGVYHARNPWILDQFGKAEGEGLRFVKSELNYLLEDEPTSIPSALVRTVCKYVGYRVGRFEARLSNQQKARLSMFPSYWRHQQQSKS